VKKTKYSGMSIGGTDRMPESSIMLLTRRGSTSPRFGVSRLSFGKGSGLIMSLRYCGMKEGPTGPH
jgi:hypothetical protein